MRLALSLLALAIAYFIIYTVIPSLKPLPKEIIERNSAYILSNEILDKLRRLSLDEFTIRNHIYWASSRERMAMNVLLCLYSSFNKSKFSLF